MHWNPHVSLIKKTLSILYGLSLENILKKGSTVGLEKDGSSMMCSPSFPGFRYLQVIEVRSQRVGREGMRHRHRRLWWGEGVGERKSAGNHGFPHKNGEGSCRSLKPIHWMVQPSKVGIWNHENQKKLGRSNYDSRKNRDRKHQIRRGSIWFHPRFGGIRKQGLKNW